MVNAIVFPIRLADLSHIFYFLARYRTVRAALTQHRIRILCGPFAIPMGPKYLSSRKRIHIPFAGDFEY